MDKNGKLFGKISIIDLLVIIIILAVAAAAVYRFASPNAAISRGEQTITFTVYVESVRDFTLTNHQTGLRIYEHISNQFLGYLVDVEYAPATLEVELLNGEIGRFEAPERISLLLTIESQGRVTDNAIFAEGTYELTAGSWINIANRYVQVFGRIVEISY
ncbi:MAG: DUF4330 domain-containing protein [Defluviitaleaceae bacterium]|nr:DUF4330 domain-containing protein [Defluviitaleaceae bacterium]